MLCEGQGMSYLIYGGNKSNLHPTTPTTRGGLTMARPTTNQSIEDYLEAILMLQELHGHCRSVDVANHLGFTKASVSVAVSNLTRRGYLNKLAGGNLVLTPEGNAYARSVLNRHRLISRALMRLGVPQEIAEKDACRIEHDISEETFARVEERFRTCEELYLA